jgi:hypothetical protein
MKELGTSMIGLDLDRQTPLDRSVMNILDNSVYAIQENFNEQQSIDSDDAQIHHSSASRNDSPDQFKSMIGIDNNILDPRMTMDLGALGGKKKNSLFQNTNDISSILPNSKDNSSFNISILGGSQNKKGKKKKNNKMMMSVSLPKRKQYSLSTKHSEREKVNKHMGSFEKILEVENNNKNDNEMLRVGEQHEWNEEPKIINNSFDLSAQTISRRGVNYSKSIKIL